MLYPTDGEYISEMFSVYIHHLLLSSLSCGLQTIYAMHLRGLSKQLNPTHAGV